MFRLILLIVLPLPLPATGADALKLPAKLECKRDKMIGVKAGSTAKRITWEIPAAVDFRPKPEGFTPTGELTRVEIDAAAEVTFTAAPGSYRIRAFCAVMESVSFAETLLVVEGESPGPGPGPGPTPKPPEPKPPEPVDPLAKLIAEKFAGITSTTKRQDATALAAVYRLAAKESINTEHATLADLVAIISDAINSAVGKDVLLQVRMVVLAELKAKAAGDELTSTMRQTAADIYRRAAGALEDAAK